MKPRKQRHPDDDRYRDEVSGLRAIFSVLLQIRSIRFRSSFAHPVHSLQSHTRPDDDLFWDVELLPLSLLHFQKHIRGEILLPANLTAKFIFNAAFSSHQKRFRSHREASHFSVVRLHASRPSHVPEESHSRSSRPLLRSFGCVAGFLCLDQPSIIARAFSAC